MTTVTDKPTPPAPPPRPAVPAPAPRPPAPASGPVTLAFAPATQYATGGMKLLLYGPPGVGKTTLAAGAPAVLFVDLDWGTRSIADRADVQVMRPDSWHGMHNLVAFLRQDGQPFQSVVIDSITEAYRLALEAAMREDGKTRPELQHHGAATEKVVRLVRDLCDVADRRGVHVLLTAPETVRTDPGENGKQTIKRASLPPRAWEGVNQAMDSVVRLMPSNGGRVAKLRTRSSLLDVKFRSTRHDIPEQLDDPTFAKLLQLRGDK